MHLFSFRLKLIYQVQKAQIILLIFKKVIVLAKYSDFINMFLKKLYWQLSDYLNIHKYIINIEEDKQLSYQPIYSLELIKLETFKTY